MKLSSIRVLAHILLTLKTESANLEASMIVLTYPPPQNQKAATKIDFHHSVLHWHRQLSHRLSRDKDINASNQDLFEVSAMRN